MVSLHSGDIVFIDSKTKYLIIDISHEYKDVVVFCTATNKCSYVTLPFLLKFIESNRDCYFSL